MRTIPAQMQEKLDNGASTFCACWRIDPVNGEPLGFTDHDRDLTFDDLTFEASSGFDANAIERSLGLAIDNTAATGALRSERLTEADIRRGRYDGAEFRLWLVDWSDVSSRILTFRGEIGEITRGDLAFEVEIRGLSEKLNRPVGRRFLRVCDAQLGDLRCGVNADKAVFSGGGTVASVADRRSFEADGLGVFETNWFADGALTWTGGANSGSLMGVRTHIFDGGRARLELDRDPVDAPAVGDTFSVVAGCDKRASTCRDKFQNLKNFRGFPHIPGDNWITSYPADGGVYQGGSRRG
ncbi:DUF2163 domain-containing protein [Pikeienuella piscinae]|uniref:DUF2163 domain-containing protein n=1 Tax=Pikeienuella piscinae TaxID=2748098 RepID=A0A7L5BX84_9RHOB|nr:DUF2163 domain-containing protein [Pikeienuella piscinae]QIE54504.1 DUF2163 domain-containing protein [Pikeienuella piscinae]